jgi:hypothetical protein
MVEPMGFKTNIGENAVTSNGKINDYNIFRQKVAAFTKKEFDKAAGPEPVVNTVLKIVNEQDPKFNSPVGKGSSVILTLQRFAYRVFENSILKRVNSVQ